MKVTWTAWAQARVLPYPGEAWTVEVDLPAAEKRLAKAGAIVPASPEVEAEIERARSLRVNERYNEKGNHPTDSNGRDLVDVWVARAGVVFATRCAIGVCSVARTDGKPYELRLDAAPWGRLREHLAAASKADLAAAKALAKPARTAKSELRQAVAFAFADPAWAASHYEQMFEDGYGQLALLAVIPDAKTGRLALKRLIEEGPDPDEYIAPFQLVENGYPFVPALMTRLDDADVDLVVRCAGRAWNNATRKPWLEIVASLDAPSAKKFLAKHGKPAAKKPSAKKPAAKKPTAKKPAVKKPAVKKPAAKKPKKR
jgi:hypothetical protein